MAVAMVNIPGSNFFRYFHGNLKQCNIWLKEVTQKEEFKENVFPQKIVSDKKPNL